MTPGSPPRAVGDHSSLETRGQEGDSSPEGTGNGGALGRSLETQGKRAAPRPGQHKTSRTARVQRRTAEGWWLGREGRQGGTAPVAGAPSGVMEVLRDWMVANAAPLGVHK